ncbi:cilia- and flagella-associated protein 161 [Stomoxys calcitrans]|uniref:cilia- and flagella-associated protein 161 n=1 Tax=Stomoxys calcitrans TaxID=35570 RepID=UPI0027E245D0|nr:cilia- and flagella-associated protein 161 [Stomoxys calcitrans]
MSLVTRSTYRPVVRLGNWYEDICLEEEKLQTFLSLRERGELMVEKTRRLYENFHKEIQLSTPRDTISFGDIVQLLPVHMQICNNSRNAKNSPALSVSINERVVRRSQQMNEECDLTLAPSVRPCIRNSFRIVSIAGDGWEDNSALRIPKEELLKYGQPFRLQCLGGGEPLLLYSSQKSWDLTSPIHSNYESRKFGEINLTLGLCAKKNCGPGKFVPLAYTHWYCQHLDPHKRFETEGNPLPSNQPLVITHMATNRNLAAENLKIHTLFGTEFVVCVQNYKNIFKRETWQNIWMISNGHQIK